MTKTTMILIGATVLSAFVAWNAFADTQTVSGASNTVTLNSNNGNNSGIINSGTGSGSNITNTATATGGAGGHGGSAYASGGSAHSTAIQGQQQDATANNEGNAQSVAFNDKKQAPGVYAPGLTSGIDTCLGSVSAGGSIAGFGLTGGGTVVDENCVRIKLSREASVKKLETASLYLLCLNDDFRAGVRLEKGKKCPQDEVASPAKIGALSPAAGKTGFPTDKKRFE